VIVQEVLGVVNNLQTLSSFFTFLSAIYNILFSFILFIKNDNTVS